MERKKKNKKNSGRYPLENKWKNSAYKEADDIDGEHKTVKCLNERLCSYRFPVGWLQKLQ